MKKRKWLLAAGVTALVCTLLAGCGPKQADQEEYRALIEEAKANCEHVADQVIADGEGVQITFVGIDEDGKYSTEYGEREESLWIFAISNSSEYSLSGSSHPYAYVNGGYNLYLNAILDSKELSVEKIKSGKSKLLYFSSSDAYIRMLQALGKPVQFSDINITFNPMTTDYDMLYIGENKAINFEDIEEPDIPNNLVYEDEDCTISYVAADSQVFLVFKNKNGQSFSGNMTNIKVNGKAPEDEYLQSAILYLQPADEWTSTPKMVQELYFEVPNGAELSFDIEGSFGFGEEARQINVEGISFQVEYVTGSGAAATEENKPEQQPEAGVATAFGDSYTYAESFQNGYAFAIKGNSCGYLDTKGNFTPYYERDVSAGVGALNLSSNILAQTEDPQMFVSEEGLFPIFDNATQKWGYADIKTGNIVVEPQYIDAMPFSEGRAVVVEQADDGKTAELMGPDGEYAEVSYKAWVIDATGNKLFELGCLPFATHYINGLLYCGMKNSAGEVENCLVDKNGNIVAAMGVGCSPMGTTVHMQYICQVGFALNTEDTDPNHIGVCVQEGQADGILGNQATFVCTTKDFYYINSSGDITARLPAGSQEGTNWMEGETACFYRVITDTSNLMGLFNEQGVALTDAIYDGTWDMRNGVATVKNGNEYSILDNNGNIRYTCQYELITGTTKDGLIKYKDGNSYGFIDESGMVVIPAQYAAASYFEDGITLVVNADDSRALLDTKGNIVVSGGASLAGEGGGCLGVGDGILCVMEAPESYKYYPLQ